jgi:LysM repeat protein
MTHSATWYARIGVAVLIAVILIAAFSGSAAAAGPKYHTVLPGQTLFSIANMYGVSLWSIACANGLYNPNYIYAGMVLKIPDGWWGYCQAPHKPPMYPPPHPYPQPYPHPGGDCFYTVKPGDHLYRIALMYGTSWVTLAYANGLYNGNYIYAGQVLRIPGCN